MDKPALPDPISETQRISTKAQVRELLQVLHIFVPPGNEPMEKILWDDQPDDAPMVITIKFGQYRKARAALQNLFNEQR